MRLGVERFNRLVRAGPLAAAAGAYNDDEAFAAAVRPVTPLLPTRARMPHRRDRDLPALASDLLGLYQK